MYLEKNKECLFLSGSNTEETSLLEQVALGKIYEHYSGKQYKVVGVFRHSEDLKLYVAYEALYESNEYGAYWIRPLTMFLETVTLNGVEQARFKKVSL